MKNQHPLSETEREDAFHVAKKAHEQERELTLSTIPIATKQWYGQIGFVLWKYPRKAKRVVRVHLPVLILGPYDVPPYHRKRWDKAKDKVTRVSFVAVSDCRPSSSSVLFDSPHGSIHFVAGE